MRFKKSISMLSGKILDVLNLDWGCRPPAVCQTSQKKGKIGMMDQEAILSPKQEGRAIRSLPVTFPPGAPSVIKGSGVGRFIKTVYAAWGTQRSLSGLEMAAVFIAVYIKSAPVNAAPDWCELINHSTRRTQAPEGASTFILIRLLSNATRFGI